MAGETFDITHETGDTTQYTSVTNPDAQLTVAGGAALVGSYGMQIVIDDTNAHYGNKTYTQLSGTTFRFRFYVDPNGLTIPNYNELGICSIWNTNTAGSRAQVLLYYDSTNYQISAGARLDDFSSQYTGYHTITDDLHYVEVRLVRASSDVASDGTLDLWIDGVSKEQETGLDIYDISQPDGASLGAGVYVVIPAATSGTLYLDDFVLRPDGTVIGAAGAGGSIFGTMLTSSIFDSHIVR